MEQSKPDPVSYPTVELAGKAVEVKFRCGDIIRLKKKYGIDIGEVSPVKGAEAIERAIAMLCVGVAHAMPDATPETLMDLVDLSQLKTISDAIGESIKKALPPVEPGVGAKATIQ